MKAGRFSHKYKHNYVMLTLPKSVALWDMALNLTGILDLYASLLKSGYKYEIYGKAVKFKIVSVTLQVPDSLYTMHF